MRGATAQLPPAGVDRRFQAFVIDRLVVWGLCGGAIWASYALLVEPGRTGAGIATAVGAVVLVALLSASALGRWGVSAGKGALGLRVVSAEHGGPIGFGPALVRTLLLALATLPTLGFGAAAIAWTALVDASGRRHGWHDVQTGSEVVDVRPPATVEQIEPDAPTPVVNLTAMRLVPPSPAPPSRIAVPPPPEPAAVGAPGAGTTGQRLGWPLAGEPPSAPPPDRPPPPPAPGQGVAGDTRAARWRVTFDTGESFLVQGLTLVGRRPEVRSGEPVRQLVSLPSDDMSLSKTHAQFQVVPDGALVAMDRGSTNGSILIRAGVTRRITGGRPVTLHDGDRVRFGDREMSVAREA